MVMKKVLIASIGVLFVTGAFVPLVMSDHFPHPNKREAKGGGYRLKVESRAKYIFPFTYRIGTKAKTYKRKKRWWGSYWAKQKADSIYVQNTYYENAYFNPPGDVSQKTWNNAYKVELQRTNNKWNSVTAFVEARFGSVTLRTDTAAHRTLPD